MNESNNNNDDKSKKDFRRSWSWFMALAAVVTVFTVGSFYIWHSNNMCRQDRIFELCRANVEYSDSLLRSAHAELLDSLRDNPDVLLADYQILERMVSVSEHLAERHSTVAVLEIEANKIQNQYEALGIWCTIITILFLIFSFYSLFKSEQLRKEGVDALENLHKISRKANEEKYNIESYSLKATQRLYELDKDATDKLESYEKSADLKIEKLDKSIAESNIKVSGINSAVNEMIENAKKSISESNGAEVDKLIKYVNSETKNLTDENKSELDKLSKEISTLKDRLDNIDEQLSELGGIANKISNIRSNDIQDDYGNDNDNSDELQDDSEEAEPSGESSSVATNDHRSNSDSSMPYDK